MKPQLWYCEKCGVFGAIMCKAEDDIEIVVYDMGKQHQKASLKCKNGPMGLRTIVVEDIREPFILRPEPPSDAQESEDCPAPTGPDGRR